jgi:hypothetical protein
MHNAYFTLFVLRAHAVALEHSKLAVEQQLTEALDAVALPVFNQGLELFDGFDAFFTGDSVVRAG